MIGILSEMGLGYMAGGGRYTFENNKRDNYERSVDMGCWETSEASDWLRSGLSNGSG